MFIYSYVHYSSNLRGPLLACNGIIICTWILYRRFLDENNLTNLNKTLITSLINLKSLGLSYTNISVTSLFAMLSARTYYNKLHLSGYRLGQLPEGLFSRIHEIQQLIMISCQLKTIGLKTLPPSTNIEDLLLSDNQLETSDYLSLISRGSLKFLNVDNNYITDICVPAKFTAATSKLLKLSINNNQISKLTPFCLNSIPYIRYLSLRNNPLIEFTTYSLLGSTGMTDL
ncbi:Slit-like protein 3 protein [Trichoplax sp. H2]|nr:Slit-like protein 3 protein [Trichoplax sp. H2]|eukprot:RDD36381.1 Slit-like protein 3 protein [Trichoplax sp. H2]